MYVYKFIYCRFTISTPFLCCLGLLKTGGTILNVKQSDEELHYYDEEEEEYLFWQNKIIYFCHTKYLEYSPSKQVTLASQLIKMNYLEAAYEFQIN